MLSPLLQGYECSVDADTPHPWLSIRMWNKSHFELMLRLAECGVERKKSLPVQVQLQLGKRGLKNRNVIVQMSPKREKCNRRRTETISPIFSFVWCYCEDPTRLEALRSPPSPSSGDARGCSRHEQAERCGQEKTFLTYFTKSYVSPCPV